MFSLIITLILFFATIAVIAADSSATSKSWTLHHSFDSGQTFTERGTLTLGFNTDKVDSSLEMKLENNKDCIDIGSTNLQSELYQLKITSNTADAEIVTSVPACQIRRANYRDELIVTLNGNAEPVSLDYHPLVSPLAPSCEELLSLSSTSSEGSNTEFTTTEVKYETATIGMMIPNLLPETKPPIGLKFFPNSKLGGGKDGAGIPGDDTQKSFLVRYWYIILPLVLMSVLGGENPSQQQEAGAGSQGQAARAGAATAAAGAGAVKQRRGKR